jgi:hypothetical protein
MSFRRTAEGLSNLRLFYDADAVVYVEGGDNSYTYEQILNNEHNVESIDVLFWRKAFSAFAPQRRCHFRAVGSKSGLLPLAADVVAEKVSHVLVCMDRDSDDLVGSLPAGRGVFSSWGYSWENDVWSASTVKEIFRACCPSGAELEVAEAEIDHALCHFIRRVRWPVRADRIARYHNIAIFRGTKPDRFVKPGKGSVAPQVDYSQLRHVIRENRPHKLPSARLTKKITIDPLRDARGHLLQTFCYRVLIYLLQRRSNVPSLPRHYANTMAIDRFDVRLRSASEMSAHYGAQFEQIDWTFRMPNAADLIAVPTKSRRLKRKSAA